MDRHARDPERSRCSRDVPSFVSIDVTRCFIDIRLNCLELLPDRAFSIFQSISFVLPRLVYIFTFPLSDGVGCAT